MRKIKAVENVLIKCHLCIRQMAKVRQKLNDKIFDTLNKLRLFSEKLKDGRGSATCKCCKIVAPSN